MKGRSDNMTNYLIKEAAKELRCGENVVRNLIKDGRIRVMKMPTQIVPDFELDRFRKEVVASQEDLSKYADLNLFKETKENKLVGMVR